MTEKEIIKKVYDKLNEELVKYDETFKKAENEIQKNSAICEKIGFLNALDKVFNMWEESND